MESKIEEFKKVVIEGNLDKIKDFIKDGIDPSIHNNLAIQVSSFKGHLEVVKFLCSLENVDITTKNKAILRSACWKGHLEIIKFLCSLENFKPSEDAIKYAADYYYMHHNMEILRFFYSLSYVNHSNFDPYLKYKIEDDIKKNIERVNMLPVLWQDFPEIIFKYLDY